MFDRFLKIEISLQLKVIDCHWPSLIDISGTINDSEANDARWANDGAA
jgi:hypothetical protein